ncbi:MAG: PLP-dependent aspartate aminotransferase family protein [candidate division KSB1 bacterium]|nr:PLP-dependent aspartate aminotransferase family protein [candidate division KSB1 bacterium]MDQ7065599.1 PLP-dependent aspartate aminotransferase family protein [candidate division KSB1 bacterium]
MGFSTDAVHAGQTPDPRTGAVIMPLFQTSTYAQSGPGEHTGYEYGRTQNPTREALEQNIAALESGKHGFAFASGMAAINTVAQLLKAGDHVIATENVYGGTYRFFTKIMENFGLRMSWVDTSDLDAVRAAWRPETRMVFVETPTNPMLVLSDIEQIARLTHERDALLVVDNTFLSPYFQRPLELGADLVLHSTTKYINGHSDVIGGVVVTGRDDLAERLAFLQNAAGGVPSPFDCWLVLRATKTLALRMRAHAENALRIAKFLVEHPRVERVLYPHLPSHPQHELALRQQKTPYGDSGSGGMVTFFVPDFATAQNVMRKLRLFTVAESLGGVESLACHPASMTHASVPPDMRAKIGITDGLIRLSVGIEDAEDLIADLDQALRE